MTEDSKWKKRFERERQARKEAETVLEDKSRALYEANETLRKTLDGLEKRVEERTQELSIAMEAAQNANKAKSAFLATMSHEIRTPMNAVLGLTDLSLRNTSPTPKQREYLDKIHQSALALLRIINDILDFSKIEAGEMDIEAKPMTFSKVLQHLNNMVSPKVREKDIEFVLHRTSRVNEHFIGDSVRLGQILLNLTYNAVKFTDHGHVTVHVDQIETEDDFAILEFSVTDTGIGIEKDKLDLLFKPFSQVDTTDTRKYEGTGLGLAIARNFIRKMDGDIHVESVYGQGTTFKFHIRLALDKDAAHKNALPVRKLAGKSVMLCCDDPVTAASIEASLAPLAPNLTTRPDVDRLNETKTLYDLIIQVSRNTSNAGIIAADAVLCDNTGHQPAILMIGDAEENDIKARIKGCPVSRYIQKPVDPATLTETVLDLMGIEGLSDNARDTEYQQETENLKPVQGARLLLVEDNKMNQQVACDLLQSARFYVDIAENGQQAVEMVQQHDYDCVLMDVQMPVMGGYEATSIIRAMPQFRDLPIIAMTANAMAADKKAAIKAGMTDYLAKPINTSKLFAKLLDVIDHKDREKPAREEKPAEIIQSPANQWPEIEGLDVQASLSNFGYDTELYQELLLEFCRAAPEMTNELNDALAANDHETARRVAHTMKGMAMTIGARELDAISYALEQEFTRAVPDNLTTLTSRFFDDVATMTRRVQRHLTMQDQIQVSKRISNAELQQLYSLLDNYDVAATEHLALIKQDNNDADMAIVLDKVDKRLSRYQFEEAAAILSSLIPATDDAGTARGML